ncbi:uncharacterized protein LOC108307177 [Cebus imitator]|uniref:uncharacterized protein LOC108307177 n=1 Tax=Cebus imitator TaxID=2715852 RepID=UPI000809B0D2|nr:uncharacterized protein LOC108307177 [Cebus imitator]
MTSLPERALALPFPELRPACSCGSRVGLPGGREPRAAVRQSPREVRRRERKTWRDPRACERRSPGWRCLRRSRLRPCSARRWALGGERLSGGGECALGGGSGAVVGAESRLRTSGLTAHTAWGPRERLLITRRPGPGPRTIRRRAPEKGLPLSTHPPPPLRSPSERELLPSSRPRCTSPGSRGRAWTGPTWNAFCSPDGLSLRLRAWRHAQLERRSGRTKPEPRGSEGPSWSAADPGEARASEAASPRRCLPSTDCFPWLLSCSSTGKRALVGFPLCMSTRHGDRRGSMRAGILRWERRLLTALPCYSPTSFGGSSALPPVS